MITAPRNIQDEKPKSSEQSISNTPKLVTTERATQLIAKVQSRILISNNIISRTKCPYYFGHKDIPGALTNFKTRITAYRSQSSQMINDLKEVPLPDASLQLRSLSYDTFAHSFVGSLVVLSFGIGECAECATQIMLDLAQAGYGNLAWVGLLFPKAKPGMEQTHGFVIANLEKPPTKKVSSLYDFFILLPTETIIIDGFLGLSFKPQNVPTEFKDYINAYGGEAKIIDFMHIYNITPKTFQCYITLATAVKAKMLSSTIHLSIDNYDLSAKTKIEDSTLITLLKNKTKLTFFGVCDSKYKVDAVVETSDEKDRQKLLNLQRSLKGHGRFFDAPDKKKIFVLEGINIPEGQPSLGNRIYDALTSIKS